MVLAGTSGAEVEDVGMTVLLDTDVHVHYL
jgi:hypothetical protein